MIYVDTKALSLINKLLSQGNPVLVICPNGIVATEWQRKIKYLPAYSRDLCKVKMSVKYNHPTIVSKDLTVVYPDFSKNSLSAKKQIN